MKRQDAERHAAAVEAAVEAYAVRHGLLPAGTRLLLLLSGGPDSMALLALVRHCDRRLGLGLQLAGLHVDYGMRGAASDRDRSIVERACSAAGVPLEVVRPLPRLRSPDFQEKARRLRLDAARRLVEAGGIDLVATGHNLDDQAETIVYRLSKYASPTALSGMAPRSGHLVRPLLGVRAADVRDYCRSRGIEYGEDHTNREEVYARNVVRHSILPQMERLNPRVVESLAAASEVAREQQAVLGSLADEVWKRLASADGDGLDVAALRALPVAVRTLVLRRLAADALGPRALIQRRHTEALLSLVDAPPGFRSVRLPAGWEAVLEQGRLGLREVSAAHHCGPCRYAVPAPDGRPVPVGFCGRDLLVEQTTGGLPVPPTSGALLGSSAPMRTIVLRHPDAGDVWRPLGLGAETPVGRFLSGQRVARRERDRSLVIEVDGAIAWVEVPIPAAGADDGARPPLRQRRIGEALRGRVAESFRVTESTSFTVAVRERG